MTRPNKLECLDLAKTFQSSLTLAGSTRSLPKKEKGPPVGFALAVPPNSKTQLERVIKGKPSSLLGLVVSDEGKKFYNVGTWRAPRMLRMEKCEWQTPFGRPEKIFFVNLSFEK
jgi:hypothetical protein